MRRRQRVYHLFQTKYISRLFIGALLFVVVQIITLHRSTSVFFHETDSLFQLFRISSPFSLDDDSQSHLHSTSTQVLGKTFFDISPQFAIHIIGERHSGVDEIQRELKLCFGHAIHVKSGLLRAAYWWQFPNKLKNFDTSTEGEYGIVVALFRNPYDWVESMRLEPKHALDHFNVIHKKPLEWQVFLNKSWTFDRIKYQDWMTEDVNVLRDIHNEYRETTHTRKMGIEEIVSLPITNAIRNRLANHSCTEDFHWFDVIPCSIKDHDSTKLLAPFPSDMLYELQRDGSGKPYENILRLREDKVIHFNEEISKFTAIQHYLPYRYEDLIIHGTDILLKQVEEALPGIKSQCKPTQPKQYIYNVLPYPMIDYLNAKINWSVEASMGYKKLSDKDWWEVRKSHELVNKQRHEEAALERNQDKSSYGIHIIGERHTGTLWLQHQLENCFGDQIKIYPSLSRYKYWFQIDDPTKDYGLVIATFRNVYDWILAMIDKPLHAPLHYNAHARKPMSEKDFLQKKWSLSKKEWDSYLKDDRDTFLHIHGIDKHLCYDNFTFFDVTPCSYNDRLRTASIVQLNGDLIDNGDSSAVYEMRRDHPIISFKAYDNILQLRRDKMLHFRSEVPRFAGVKHYIPVKFEEMVDQGTEELIANVEVNLGIKSTCTPVKLESPNTQIYLDRYTEDFLRRVNERTDWDVEALLGYEKKTKDRQFYGIHIVGERHTGTTWIKRHLERCFGGQIKVYDRLSRHKYWFQLDDESKDFGFVVATSRNVYDWLFAMMVKPLHAPIHYNSIENKSLSFQDFVGTEWAPDRNRWTELQILKDDQQLRYAYEHADLFENVTRGKPLQLQPCYDGFTFDDVVPCSFADRMRSSTLVSINGDSIDDGDSSAVYELKKDLPFTRPYKNIFELRRDKMIHFHMELPKFTSIQYYANIKFEDMIEIGTASLLQQIEEKMGHKAQCKPDKLNVLDDSNKHLFLSSSDISTINKAVDWDTEAYAGYSERPRDRSEFGIHIIGERHTGTTWIKQHLEHCFGDQVHIYDRLSRHKYWFQLDDETKDYGLVVATFRDVYSWIQAMRKRPLHAPSHFNHDKNVPMDIMDFLRTPWVPDRYSFC